MRHRLTLLSLFVKIMLDDTIKKEIQTAYSALLDAKGYKARFCQKQMIADIANTLGNIEVDENDERTSEDNICVIEAGTGTGKTIAYAISALPIAKALGKKLVISTATIALQEQIVLVDLPDLKKHSGLNFSFALAKGRRRYLCLSRLDEVLQAGSDNSPNQSLAFLDEGMIVTDEAHQALFETMLVKLGRGEWDGDKDNWSEEIEYSAWSQVSTDHVQCTGRQCSHYDNCFFYKARESIHRVDCIVTNHDLVMSDIMMGGGAVLPPPEEAIYIFDEGHHLPDKAINHFASFMQVRTSQSWLEQIPSTLSLLSNDLGEIGGLPRTLPQFESSASDLVALLEDVVHLFDPLREEAEGNDMDVRYRFVEGKVDPAHRKLSEVLLQTTHRLEGLLSVLQSSIEDALIESEPSEQDLLEHWLPIVASMASRTEGNAKLWRDYASHDNPDEAPKARWINFREGDELNLQASPIAVHESLNELLWSRCFGAVVTSATLAVGSDFTRFRHRAGISETNSFRALLSPFRYQEKAVLSIPRMDVDPRQADEHNDAVADMLPSLIGSSRGNLILFASWRQMFRVSDALPAEFMEKVMSQGDLSKAEIIAQHKKTIDAGGTSIIFGLASFAEGIDLPGAYCEHVVIVKIPFAVPNDPVGATMSEWIEAKGGNSFQEIMIPDAALRLTQACGRLLRTESDTGKVSILDRRLVTQRYGSMLLNALQPFRREIQ
ncbi:MAG: ATP-dependent DNA helicase DinG [Candidatus Azotimanducaceae bacterium]|jgi:ATP-dependent DNA helicase DinG